MTRRLFQSDLFVGFTNYYNNQTVKNNKNIYMGIGICSRSSLSLAVPIDIISLILCAEQFRRSINANKVLYIIADTHSLLTGHEPKQVMDYTANLSRLLDNIIRDWELPHVAFISSFMNEIDYSNAYKARNDQKYMNAQIEDMYYFINRHQVGYKMGWRYTKHVLRKNVGFDEWYFDKQARKINIPLDFCYIQSGHTMNEQMCTVSPYICLDLKNRIYFKDLRLNEKMKQLISDEGVAAKKYKEYLLRIQWLHHELLNKPVKGLLPFITDLNKQFS